MRVEVAPKSTGIVSKLQSEPAGGRGTMARPWSRILLLGLCTLLAGAACSLLPASGVLAPCRFLGAPVCALADDNSSWDEAAGLDISVGDSLDPGARIFDSPDYQQQLVVPSAGGQAFLLGLKTQAVQVIARSAVKWTDDKPQPDASAGTSGGNFLSDAGIITFTVGDRNWKIAPKPPLVGAVTLDALKTNDPEYAFAAARIQPDPGPIAALKKVSDDTHIVVFFGSWCSNCKHWLPHLLRTLEVVGNPRITTEFYGMSEDQLEPKDPIRQYGVSSTPTIIVLRGGRELGRIVEKPDTSVEGDLARILGVS